MKIVTRIQLVALGLVLATALEVGLVMVWGYSALISNRQREGLHAQANIEAQRVEHAVSDLISDARLLVSVPDIDRVFTDRRQAPMAERMVANLLHDLLLTHPHYVKARLIGVADNGREVIRFDRMGGDVVRTTEENLQHKGTRDFFLQGIQQTPGIVSLSDVTLNHEKGAIEVPHRSMLRAMAAVYDSHGQAVGIVIINMHFQPFLKETFHLDNGLYAYYLTNQDGDYLLNPDPAKCYGFDLGHRYRMQDDFPETTALFHGNLKDFNDGQLYLVKMYIFPHETQRYLVLGLCSNAPHTDAATASIASWASLFTVGLLLISLPLTYLLTRRLGRPLIQLTHAADQIARDEAYPALPVHRRDEIGTLSRAFVHMVDILQQHEAGLTETNEKLKMAMEDLEHFVHIASHDLREPARRVAGFADLLLHRQRDQMSEDAVALLERLRGAAERMLDQITELRAFTQISSNTAHREVVPLTELVASVLEPYQEQIQQRHIRVEIQPLPTLTVYEPLVRQLYENLIANALHHTPVDGFDLTSTAEWHNDRWVLGVRNTGSHVEPQHQQQVFTPFVRMEQNPDHMGVGLAICRHIVERHAGHIHMESGPDYVHVKFELGKEPVDEESRSQSPVAVGHGR